MKRLLIAALVGLALGAVVSKYLFVGSWLNLVLWGAAGVVIGSFSRSLKASLADGALFGFVLSFSFMMVGYTGTMSRVSRILPFSVFGVFGAICGMVLAIAGYAIVRRLRAERTQAE